MVTRSGFFGREGIFPPLHSLRRADFSPPLGFPFAGDLADIRADLLAELVAVGEGDRGLAGVGEVEAGCDEMQGDRHGLVAAGELLGEETGRPWRKVPTPGSPRKASAPASAGLWLSPTSNRRFSASGIQAKQVSAMRGASRSSSMLQRYLKLSGSIAGPSTARQ